MTMGSMKWVGLAIGATLLAGAAAPASAGVVTIQSRSFGGVVDPGSFTTSADYVAGWNTVLSAEPTAPAGYGDFTAATWDGSVSNRSLGGSAATDLAFHYQATFDVGAGETGSWSFRVAPDFGYGGTLLVDGVALSTKTTDLWWGGDWNATDALLAGSISLSAGQHTLSVYGFEGCCDGGTGGQFLRPGAGVFETFVTSAGAVPEPATWGLMIAGFGGVGAALRRRRKLMAMVAA